METFLKTFRCLDQIILLPTYSAGEKNNSYDSSFLYQKIKSKNKSLVKSISNIKDIIEETNLVNSVLVLQGAGDIKNIITILKKDNAHK